MTNVEYKKRAQEILDEVASIEFENDNTITNISELFYLKIREAIIHWRNKKISTYNEFINLTSALSEDNTNVEVSDSSISLGNNIDIQENECYYKIVTFRCYQLLIDDLPNIENVLLQLGIENPKEFAARVKSIDKISSKDDWEIVNMTIDYFLGKDDKQKSYFTGLSFYYQLKRYLLVVFGLLDKDTFLWESKRIKYIGEHYFDIYKERITIYRDILNNFDEYFTHHFRALIRIFKQKYPNYLKGCKLNDFYDMDKEDSQDNLLDDMPDDYPISPAIILDIMFLAYFFLYHHPVLIPTGFWLLKSDKTPFDLKKSLRESLKKSDYAPLVQYEYDCYQNRFDKTEDLFKDFFYSGAAVDLSTYGIVDYDLFNCQYSSDTTEENNSIQEPTQIETSSSLFQQCSDIFSWIDNELYPYYVLFEANTSTEKGHLFRKVYLAPLITYADAINDDYSLYGFAYLIYKSQYLNWHRLKFNDGFVRKIGLIFAIKSPNTKKYSESKAQCKAWAILEKSEIIPTTLLANEEVELLKFKFGKKK